MDPLEKAKKLLDLLDQAPKGARAIINLMCSVMGPEEMHDTMAWIEKMHRAIQETSSDAQPPPVPAEGAKTE